MDDCDCSVTRNCLSVAPLEQAGSSENMVMVRLGKVCIGRRGRDHNLTIRSNISIDHLVNSIVIVRSVVGCVIHVENNKSIIDTRVNSYLFEAVELSIVWTTCKSPIG